MTYVAYMFAVWINHISRWLDMSLTGGIAMLQSSFNPLGVFNSFVILSLAVIFAAVSFLKLKRNNILSKWFGLSLTMVSLHFIILLIFYALINSLHVVYLFEIWMVPLFGLGLSIMLSKK